jgi:hypothetical protein
LAAAVEAVHNIAMNMDDYLKQYLPDFDTVAKRSELQAFSHEDLVEMLLMAYKNNRVLGMMADIAYNKLRRIQNIAEESTEIPSVDKPPSNFPE